MLEKLPTDQNKKSKKKTRKWTKWPFFDKEITELTKTTKKIVNSETTQQSIKVSAWVFARLTHIILGVFLVVGLANVLWAYFNNTNQDIHTIMVIICLMVVVLAFDNGKTLFRMKAKSGYSRYFGALVVVSSVIWGISLLASYFDLTKLHKSINDVNVFTFNLAASVVVLGLLQLANHEQNNLQARWPKLIYYPIILARVVITAYANYTWTRYEFGAYIGLISLFMVFEFALYILLFRRFIVRKDDTEDKPKEDDKKVKPDAQKKIDGEKEETEENNLAGSQ